MVKDCFYWATLQTIPEIGFHNLMRLYHYFSSGKDVWKAKEHILREVPNFSPQVAEKIVCYRRILNPEKTAEELAKKEIKLVLLNEPEYPSYLSNISDPPVLLYFQGKLPPREMPLLAIVGARRATPYGIAVAQNLSGELAQRGWGIVSGMARGIDAAAHEGALQENGYTLAVLGCGIDICYPRENYLLKERIREKGCLLTEFPSGTRPEPKNFPIRNRIISGCALGTLVVEAGEKSGSLITATLALEQGREVFAVPGPITSIQSKGANSLIKQGAKLVAKVEDILEEFPYFVFPESRRRTEKSSVILSLTPEESAVFKFITLEPTHIDQLAEATGLAVSVVSGILTMLEVKGMVKQLPGNYFVCTDVFLV